MKVKLTKKQSNHNNLRTDEMIGTLQNKPELGYGITVYGEGIVFGTRIIQTSPIQKIEVLSDGILELKTENSIYTLEFLE